MTSAPNSAMHNEYRTTVVRKTELPQITKKPRTNKKLLYKPGPQSAEEYIGRFPCPPHPSLISWGPAVPSKINRFDAIPVACHCNKDFGCVSFADREKLTEKRPPWRDWFEVWCTRCFQNYPFRIRLSALVAAYKTGKYIQLPAPGEPIPEAIRWNYESSTKSA